MKPGVDAPFDVRKKPVVVQAIQWTGDNLEAVMAFVGDQAYWDVDLQVLEIETLEGVLHAHPTDFIIRGVQGEFYPCRMTIFIATYEEAA